MFGSIISSVATFFAYGNDLIQNMTSWMQGDFSMIMSGNYELMYISIPILLIAYFYANKFTIAGMGEDFARNLGLDYRQVVNIGLIIVALVTASVVLSIRSEERRVGKECRFGWLERDEAERWEVNVEVVWMM